MRYISARTNSNVRIVGLSTALANAQARALAPARDTAQAAAPQERS